MLEPFTLTVIVTTVRAFTAEVGIVKFPEVDPAVTTKVAAGFETAVLLDETEIVYPLAGAAPLSVTVPVVLLPPSTLAGRIENEVSVGAVTVRGAVTVVPFADADIVTVVWAATGDVVTVKVADEAPA